MKKDKATLDYAALERAMDRVKAAEKAVTEATAAMRELAAEVYDLHPGRIVMVKRSRRKPGRGEYEFYEQAALVRGVMVNRYWNGVEVRPLGWYFNSDGKVGKVEISYMRQDDWRHATPEEIAKLEVPK